MARIRRGGFTVLIVIISSGVIGIKSGGRGNGGSDFSVAKLGQWRQQRSGAVRRLTCLGRCGGESLDEGLVDGGAVRPDFVDE